LLEAPQNIRHLRHDVAIEFGSEICSDERPNSRAPRNEVGAA
jgi:hypothetical protein